MKRMFAILLVLCLMVSAVPLAYAEDSICPGDEKTTDQVTPDSAGEQTEDQDSTDTPDDDDISPVTVGTLEELQAAIAAAEEGDTIIISNTIIIEGDCSIGIPGKQVLLIGDGSCSYGMIIVRNGTLSVTAIDFDGGNVIGGISCTYGTLVVSECSFSNMIGAIGINYGANGTIIDCNFSHNEGGVGGGYVIDELRICGCTFTDNSDIMACIQAGGNITIEDCLFEGNTSYGAGCGAVFLSSGTITISDSSFIGNKTTVGKGSAISNGAELTISNCFFDQNTSDTAGDDIFSWNDGTVTITDTDQQMSELYSKHNLVYDGAYEDSGVERSAEDHFMHEDEDNEADNTETDTRENRFIDCETSTRIPLPATQYSGGIHFESHIIEEQESEQQPQEPGDQSGDNNTTGGEQPPQEPTQPSKGEGTGDSTDKPSKGDNSGQDQPSEDRDDNQAQPSEDDGQELPPAADGDDQQTPPAEDDDDDQTPPTVENEEDTGNQEPPGAGDDDQDQPPAEEGDDQKQPPEDDGQEPPTGDDADQQPPEDDGQDQPRDDEQEQPPEDGEQEPPTDPADTPQEPSNDQTDDDTGPAENPPQKPPSGPVDNGRDHGYDYLPPSWWWSSAPSTPPTNPTLEDGDKDIPVDNTSPEDTPKLVCGGATIDTSRTVVLLGYGDGLPHENDSLTRAQLATIIYRLLDDDSIALYSNAPLAFVDIAADAWYVPYIRVIQAAGIVNGVGDGKYDPDGTVTWAHIVTILTRFVEAQETELHHIQYDGWATPALKTAVALGWIADSADFIPDAVISRGELVQLINGVLALYQ